MSRNLVIGASGQVGWHLYWELLKSGEEVCGTYRNHPVDGMIPLELEDFDQVNHLICSQKPDVLFIPASNSNVDYCETHPDETRFSNVQSMSNVINTTLKTGSKLVYFSSDYVFNGCCGPYSETDPTSPVCEYGRQKVMVEQEILTKAENGLVIRTTGVYGWELQRKNFVLHLLDKVKNKEFMKVPVDQLGNPTYARDLAQATIELTQKQYAGVIHVAGQGRVNRYEFACEVLRTFGFEEKYAIPVPTASLGQIAPRPLAAGLLSAYAESILSTHLTTYTNGVKNMIKDYEEYTHF